MPIRPATPEDAEWAAPLIAATIGAVGRALTGERGDAAVARALLPLFRAGDNRLGFENVTVAVSDTGPLGLLAGYPGEGAAALDEPFRLRLLGLGKPDRIQTEAEPDEWYLDTLGVLPRARGRGVGSALIKWQTTRLQAQGFTRLGLLVEVKNEGARRLYARLGFHEVGRRELAGDRYLHLQREL